MSILRALSDSLISTTSNSNSTEIKESSSRQSPQPTSPLLKKQQSPIPQPSTSSPHSHSFPATNMQPTQPSTYPIPAQIPIPIQSYAIPYFPCYTMHSYPPPMQMPMYYPSAPISVDPSTGYPMMMYYVTPMTMPVASNNAVTSPSTSNAESIISLEPHKSTSERK
ncbi:hypothetical protein HMI55_006383 [Coelomomyces lativittatus]|nr:hypothetical protein HMI55_006383 [Coelomomyces lativittatus]